jgi:hypothetical protein
LILGWVNAGYIYLVLGGWERWGLMKYGWENGREKESCVR